MIWFYARKARGAGRAAISLVLGKLRVRTKRPLECDALRRIVIHVFRSHYFIGRISPFDPMIESCENVIRRVRRVRPIRTELTEGICAGSAAAMRHPGDHEKTIEVSDGFMAAHFLRHRMMVVDVVDRRDGSVAPAHVLDQFSAVSLEGT